MTQHTLPELLAPAGDMSCFLAGMAAGADAAGGDLRVIKALSAEELQAEALASSGKGGKLPVGEGLYRYIRVKRGILDEHFPKAVMEHTGKDIRCGKLRELFAALAEHGSDIFGGIVCEEVGLDTQPLAAG